MSSTTLHLDAGTRFPTVWKLLPTKQDSLLLIITKLALNAISFCFALGLALVYDLGKNLFNLFNFQNRCVGPTAGQALFRKSSPNTSPPATPCTHSPRKDHAGYVDESLTMDRLKEMFPSTYGRSVDPDSVVDERMLSFLATLEDDRRQALLEEIGEGEFSDQESISSTSDDGNELPQLPNTWPQQLPRRLVRSDLPLATGPMESVNLESIFSPEDALTRRLLLSPYGSTRHLTTNVEEDESDGFVMIQGNDVAPFTRSYFYRT